MLLHLEVTRGLQCRSSIAAHPWTQTVWVAAGSACSCRARCATPIRSLVQLQGCCCHFLDSSHPTPLASTNAASSPSAVPSMVQAP